MMKGNFSRIALVLVLTFVQTYSYAALPKYVICQTEPTTELSQGGCSPSSSPKGHGCAYKLNENGELVERGVCVEVRIYSEENASEVNHKVCRCIGLELNEGPKSSSLPTATLSSKIE